MRYIVRIVRFALLSLFLLPENSMASTVATEQLGRWGDTQLSKVTDVPDGQAVPTTVVDHFGRKSYTSLASGGKRLLTAGKGSTWVYDTVHHIAAVSESGDVNGNSVFYLSEAATIFPQRNLSHVTSARGLFLGITSVRAAAILGVPSSAIVRSSPRKATLYARKTYRCGASQCSHDAILEFVADRAVAISLDDVGP